MSRLSRPPLAAVAAAVLVLAGCTTPFGAKTGPREPAGAGKPGAAPNWRDCPETAKDLVGRTPPNMRFECATIAVPRDWQPGATGGASGSGTAPATGATAPGPAGTFEISLVRIRSTKQHDRIGSLLINPGGPGGSGVDTAVYLSFGTAFGGLPDAVTQRFDIVGFDPRGVKRSSPVKCLSDAELDANFGYEPDPEPGAEFDGLVALDKKIGAACGAKYPDQLGLFSTEQAARDIDAIRSAVGDQKLTYLGYSYGTLLGATYAQLFPRNVRAMVLDGAVDPKQDAVAGSESQAKGFEKAFDNFGRWCARTPAKCPIAPDARAAVTDVLNKARVSPVRGSGGREATAGWIFYAIVSSLYTESGWEQLAGAVEQLEGATRPGCSSSPTSTPSATRTGTTPTSSTRTWRSTAPTSGNGRARSRPASCRRSGGRSTRCSGRRSRSACSAARTGRASRIRTRPARRSARRRSWWSAPPATRPPRTSRPSGWPTCSASARC
ncbi:hypothetical protein GCM10027605_21510 [Micromonospora zhanjiangensis]